MKASKMWFMRPEQVPLQQCRGIEHSDKNNILLVRAAVELVARAFTQVRQAVIWERDVYEREIEVGGQDYIVFRLKGHPWTLIHGQRVLPYGLSLNDKDAQALSNWLQTDAIYYWESDTSGSIGYCLYNCGNCTEKLSDEDGDDEEGEDSEMEQFLGQLANRHQTAPLSKDERYSAIAAFLGHKQAERGNEPEPFETFFREQDAYVPALSWQQNSKVGQRVTLRLEGLEREDLERMDYVALK